jgi:hypothetical protein
MGLAAAAVDVELERVGGILSFVFGRRAAAHRHTHGPLTTERDGELPQG